MDTFYQRLSFFKVRHSSHAGGDPGGGAGEGGGTPGRRAAPSPSGPMHSESLMRSELPQQCGRPMRLLKGAHLHSSTVSTPWNTLASSKEHDRRGLLFLFLARQCKG